MSRTRLASRRQFLKASLGAVLLATAGKPLLSTGFAEPSGKTPIGLQLYAVRGEFARDVPGTLEAVRKIGYQGVEFWGYGGTTKVFGKYGAKELHRILEDQGLRCCGMHVKPDALEGDNLHRTVENNRILENQYVVVAAAKKKMKSKDTIKAFADSLTKTAAALKKDGMRVGYHAHGFDFAKIDGSFAWEILFQHAGPDVVMQMDVGNCLAGGGDPIAMLKKFPGRSATIHVKEHGEKTFDSAYYRQVFRLCETTGQTKWYIVEMGGPRGDGFEVPRNALGKLKPARA